MSKKNVPYIQRFKFEEADPPVAGEFNLITFFLSAAAISLMLGIFLIVLEEEPIWARYSLMMFFFGLIGVISINYYHNKRFAIFSNYYRKLNYDHGFLGFLTYGVLMLIQVSLGILEAYLAPTQIIQIAYTVFSAVCEELFYRGFILGFFIFWANGFGKTPEKRERKSILVIGAIISAGLMVSAGAFAFSHTNYYERPILVVSVFLSGLVLGLVYVWKKDIMIPIIGHFLLNFTVVLPELLQVMFGGLI